MDDLWNDAEVISSYTRAQAIQDGVLIDLGKLATDAGFRVPVAITGAAYAEAINWTQDDASQDEKGRAWDVLTIARAACTRPGEDQRRTFTVARVLNQSGAIEALPVQLAVHIGGGDHAEPVVTITLPDED